MAKFDRVAYKREYNKKHYKDLNLQFDVEKDKDIIDFLWKQDNKKQYIVSLLRKQIKREGK